MERESDHLLLGQVYPDLRPRFRRLVEDVRISLGLDLRITEALRDLAAQEARYAQGRTAPGKIITDAKPGLSWHNYGLALDIAFRGKDPYLEKDPRGAEYWDTFGKHAIANGFVWGGGFKRLVDKPHLQMTYGLSITEAQELYRVNGISAVWTWIDQQLGFDTSRQWLALDV